MVDVDIRDDKCLNGVDTWKKWIERHGEINTPYQKTQSGGFQYFFKWNKNLYKLFGDNVNCFEEDGETVGIAGLSHHFR